jgi:hypothetical protein
MMATTSLGGFARERTGMTRESEARLRRRAL